MATIRAFVALHLPEPVKSHLVEMQAVLNNGLPRGAVRWVKPDAMHLTLRFLGETAPGKIDALRDALAAAAVGHAPPDLTLDRIGYFPNRQRPRVVWAGLRGDTTELAALKDAIDAAIAPLGWPSEARPFAPHLTLGRVKEGDQPLRFPERVPLKPLSFRSATFSLFRSDLHPSGPVYTTLAAFTLAAG